MNKVIENMLGKSIEQMFEEIEVEEVRAKRQAETEAQMRDKGKSAEGSIEVSERSIVPSLVVENPVPISAVSAVFDEDVLLDDVITAEGDDEDDSEEDADEEKIDDPDDVFSASSHSDDDNNDDDDDQGGAGVTTTEASNEKNVDDYMNDGANEVSREADGKGEHVGDQNVDESEKLIL
ncbi:trigger factor-like [Helianthus annuus]|uniref:trigger factor-like n=1 Tax=Helianthus annuus TaxID=4232 RepID=UPI000B8FD391|nr:trigger factor-like [Helianthus annuus]